MNTPDNLDSPDVAEIPEQPEQPEKRVRKAYGERKKEMVAISDLTPDEMATKRKKKGYPQRKIIANNWDKILKAIGNGYSNVEICNVFGICRKTYYSYLQDNPHRKAEIERARYNTRDEMLQVILDAAAKGNWIPAAWFLERVFPHTFAKPEVKLQMYDRLVNNDVVQQKIGGKTIDEIATELKLKYGDNENVQKFFSDAGTGSTAGSNGNNEPESVSE